MSDIMLTTESLLVILLLAICIRKFIYRAYRLIGWILCCILLMQTGYALSYTALNDYIPFDMIFKYDILQYIAEICSVDILSEILIFINNLLKKALNVFAECIIFIAKPVIKIFKNANPLHSR